MKIASIEQTDGTSQDVVLDARFGEHVATVELVPLSEMTVFPEVQRRFKPNWANQLATRFDPHLVGVITLNRRPGGQLAVINGQHRRAAGQIAGYNDTAFTCHVYQGLSMAEEAKLFLALNDNRAVASVDLFIVGIRTGDSVSVGVEQILSEFDLAYGTDHRQSFMAIKTALTVFQDNGAVTGPTALRAALHVVTKAWRTAGRGQSGYLNGTIVHGLANMALLYGAKFNVNHMAEKLQSFPGGPQGILGNVRGRRTTQKGSASTVCRIVLTELYNKGLSGSKQLEVVSTNLRFVEPTS